ncbi:MAG: CapA family protein [Ilumatobacteraceae bacterium]
MVTTVPVATTAAATTTTLPPVRHFTTIFSGDLLIHAPVYRRAATYAGGEGYDFVPMFVDVKPLVSSVDLAICHLEVPIAPPDEEPQTSPRYAAPKELIAAVASAGYDRCSTSSNHTMDQGVAGIDATLAAFDEQGLTQSGMARHAFEGEPTVLDVNGVAVTHLSYTFPTLHVPNGQPWRANNIDPDRIIADARTARAKGAEVVIVSLHWGTEGISRPSPFQREVAEPLTASGVIDLIVGHHAHVVQPIEQVNGVWTVFGMGNFLSNMPTGTFPPSSQDGVLVQVGFDVAPDGKVTVGKPIVYPTFVDKDATYVIQDVLAELASSDLTERERLIFERSLERVSSVVGEFVATAPFSR